MTARGLVKDGPIVVDHMDTDSKMVDPLTKGLRPIVFKRHIENMGIVSSFDIFG